MNKTLPLLLLALPPPVALRIRARAFRWLQELMGSQWSSLGSRWPGPWGSWVLMPCTSWSHHRNASAQLRLRGSRRGGEGSVSGNGYWKWLLEMVTVLSAEGRVSPLASPACPQQDPAARTHVPRQQHLQWRCRMGTSTPWHLPLLAPHPQAARFGDDGQQQEQGVPGVRRWEEGWEHEQPRWEPGVGTCRHVLSFSLGFSPDQFHAHSLRLCTPTNTCTKGPSLLRSVRFQHGLLPAESCTQSSDKSSSPLTTSPPWLSQLGAVDRHSGIAPAPKTRTLCPNSPSPFAGCQLKGRYGRRHTDHEKLQLLSPLRLNPQTREEIHA